MWLTCSTLQLAEGLVHDDHSMKNIWIPPHSIHYREEGNNFKIEAFANNLISAFLLFIVHP